MNRLPLLFLLFSLACTPSDTHPEAQRLAAQIVGQWSMETVFEMGRDVTADHDPSDNRWIAFAVDGTFVSDGDPHGRNTGHWRIHEDTRELFLDSDAGEDDDSYWIVQIEDDSMRWKGTRSAFTERFEIIHAR